MRSIELLIATATQAVAGGSAAAAVTGDSLTVKNGKSARIITGWADMQTAGFVQIVRPSGHDTTRDLRFRVPASEVELFGVLGIEHKVEPQETLAITIGAGGVVGDVETVGLLMEYEDLNGVNQRLLTWDQLENKIEETLTLDCTLTAAVGPAFSTSEELITAESDLLKANRDYAVLGYRCSVECAAIYIKGQDTGNVRIGGPGNDLDGDLTNQWFAMLSRAIKKPMIPIINSGNKANTFIGCHQDENATAVPVSLNLALLKK